jgi:glycosyltransferase involved in cell wall biosynthesis
VSVTISESASGGHRHDQPPLKNKRVSIVVPLWNEEENIESLVRRLSTLVPASHCEWEFVFVNDGSQDRTVFLVRQHAPALGSWKLVELSRNFGQQAAYRAGLDHATGDAIVFLDADMQDPPELIGEMIERWRNGAKVVTGVRRSRAEKGIRRVLFDSFHHIFAYLTSGAIPKNSGTFGLMDRSAADSVRAMPELNMFLPAMRYWVGFRHEVVWYDRAARDGEPKQSLGKLVSYAWDGITSFSVLPLKAISAIGLLFSLVGFGYAAVLIAIKLAQLLGLFRELIVPGFTTLAVAILFLGGIQLLCLGLIGEYVAKIYREVKRRPAYIVDTVSGPEEERQKA